VTEPRALPTEPLVQPMPEPMTPEFYEWLRLVGGLSMDRLVEHAGCVVRGCRVGREWDAEHGCHVFVHNGKIINWDTYRNMTPQPTTDAEAFFRVIFDEHAIADGKPRLGQLQIPAPRQPTTHLDNEEKKLVNRVYAERDMLVALVCRLSQMAGFEVHIAPDETQPDEWKNVVFVELPSGQVSWHIHVKELGWFEDVPRRDDNKWDGHTDEEKYARVLAPFPWRNRG
jgi:hypothetical protein